MARPAHRHPKHIPAHRYPTKLPSARAVGTGALAAGCLAMTLVPVSAGAKGRGGGHGGGGPVPIGGGSGTATCSVPATPLGGVIDIRGTGYAPNEMLQEWMSDDAMTAISFIGADPAGTLSGQLGYANHAGSYSVSVKDSASGAAEATCSFTVS